MRLTRVYVAALGTHTVEGERLVTIVRTS